MISLPTIRSTKDLLQSSLEDYFPDINPDFFRFLNTYDQSQIDLLGTQSPIEILATSFRNIIPPYLILSNVPELRDVLLACGFKSSAIISLTKYADDNILGHLSALELGCSLCNRGI
jgi:hypothetical protein